MRKHVKLLSYPVDDQGTNPNNEKVVVNWDEIVLQGVDERCNFLSLVAYYSTIQEFSHTTVPLHNLQGKDVNFEWTNVPKIFQIVVFSTSGPFSFCWLFHLGYRRKWPGHQCCIAIRFLQEVRRVILFWSQLLRKPEKTHCTTREEMQTIVYSALYFRHYSLWRNFVIRTDPKAAIRLYSFGDHEERIVLCQVCLQEWPQMHPLTR